MMIEVTRGVVRVVKELMTVGKKVWTTVAALTDPPAPATKEVTTDAPGGSTWLIDADAEIEAELEAGDCPPGEEPDDWPFGRGGWLKDTGFGAADRPNEADERLEPPTAFDDAKIPDTPLDTEGALDPSGWPDDAELAGTRLRGEVGLEPPAALDDAEEGFDPPNWPDDAELAGTTVDVGAMLEFPTKPEAEEAAGRTVEVEARFEAPDWTEDPNDSPLEKDDGLNPPGWNDAADCPLDVELDPGPPGGPLGWLKLDEDPPEA